MIKAALIQVGTSIGIFGSVLGAWTGAAEFGLVDKPVFQNEFKAQAKEVGDQITGLSVRVLAAIEINIQRQVWDTQNRLAKTSNPEVRDILSRRIQELQSQLAQLKAQLQAIRGF